MVYTADTMITMMEAMTEVKALEAELCLIVTNWPGQGESKPFAAPKEMRTLIELNMAPPFVRKATADETVDYAIAHRLFSGPVDVVLRTCRLLAPKGPLPELSLTTQPPLDEQQPEAPTP